jgi:ribosomal protein S27AE
VRGSSTRECPGCGAAYVAHGGRIACIRCRLAALQSPEHKARAIVRQRTNKAIKEGGLVRQPCEVCGAERVDAHHDDYARPLDIRWLCRSHHRQHHKKFGPGKSALVAETASA